MARGKRQGSSRDVMTTGQVAEICNVTIRTVIRWFEKGLLEGYRIPGSKDRRIPRESLIKFMKAHDMPLDRLDQGGRRRILIADDDQAILTLLRAEFEQLGLFEIHTASTGYEAGVATGRLKPHVILLDYYFGDTTGDVVAQTIREDEELEHVRIIVMSGDPDVESRLNSSIDAFIPKPLDFDRVKEQIFSVLQLA